MAEKSAKKVVAVLKPPKPISQMSEAERRAFADQLFERAARAEERQAPKRPAH